MAAVTLALILALVLALGMYFRPNPELSNRQRSSLLLLRFVTLFLAFLFLLLPVLYYIRRFAQKPLVILLKDTSASMLIEQKAKTKSSALEQAFNRIKAIYKASGYAVKEHSFADGLDGANNTTYLIPALEKIRELSGEQPLRQIYVFSDGWFRDADLTGLKNYGIPISTVSDTARISLADLQISELRHNRQGYRNELCLFEPTLISTGYSGQASVAFLVDGKKTAEQRVSFSQNQVQTLSFKYRFPALGLHKVEIRISAAGIREQILTNNSYVSAIDILSDKEKILLLTDVPNWDIKFILDAIKGNNRLEPLSFTVKGNDLYSGEQKTSISDWDNITAILIVNKGNLQLSPGLTANIINKTRQGAGLLCMGITVTQLFDVLPLKTSNLHNSYNGLIRLLPAAGAYAAFRIPDEEITQIPPVDYYYLTPAAGAEVLAVMDNVQKSPAIAISAQAGSKSASFAFLNLWRWQMQSKTTGYRSFIQDVISWLSNKSAGQLHALYEPSYYLDEPIDIKLAAVDELRQTNRNLSPLLAVFDAQNDSVFSDFLTEDKDTYSISFRLHKAGAYHFRIVDKVSGKAVDGRFLVNNTNLESRDWGYNNEVLSWIAIQTGGKHLSLAEASDLKPVKASAANRIEKREFPLYRLWYIIALFIIAFCLELYLRRRWGLI